MALARELGITPTRVTQIMNLLKLAPQIQEHILNLPPVRGKEGLSEKHTRTLCRIPDQRLQKEVFGHLCSRINERESRDVQISGHPVILGPLSHRCIGQ
jgi:hypothetical protein